MTEVITEKYFRYHIIWRKFGKIHILYELMGKWKYKTRKELEKTIVLTVILLKEKRLNGGKYCVKGLRIPKIWCYVDPHL
jgi:hypothetical protein